MSEAASDDVVQALEFVVDKFGDAIGPYAVALAAKLGTPTGRGRPAEGRGAGGGPRRGHPGREAL